MRAILVYCEGNHDIVYVTRSLGVAGARWLGEPISKLPSPFGPLPDPRNPRNPKVHSIISRHYAARSLDDLHLVAAAHAPPPVFEAMLEDDGTLYVLIRCHGDSAALASATLTRDIATQLPFGVTVREIAAAFLFDADDAGLASRESRFKDNYADLLNGASPSHAGWVTGPVCPVGLYVFHDPVTGKGTLEEILAPMVDAEWPTRWSQAGTYLSSNRDPDDPVTTDRTEALKAQICITGQFRFAGDPMTQVLRKEGLPRNHFSGAESQSLVQFLRNVPW
ncbi:MAG: hypothetical protein ABIO70_09800 [Pseudomonadota bacterium]